MSGFDLNTMLMHGWPVLSVLLIMSVFSITVIVDRWLTMRRGQVDTRAFVAKVSRIVREQSPAAAQDYCRNRSQPIAAVAAAVLAQAGGREARERALQHAMQAQIREMESYVPILGTIASSAPFVGLFGTVVGIIRAFSDIASNVGGGPEVVASGIAEALVTTAGGLLVAIPALIGYNYFVRQIQRETDAIDIALYDLIEALCEPRGT
jgi:biopolymer transport protein ExbB/TolQ